MSNFSPIVDATTSMSLVVPSAPVPQGASGPSPRFVTEPVRWLAVGNFANVYAFARSAARWSSGTSAGIPGQPTLSWTLLELSPLPAFAAKTLLALPGGLPVQYLLLSANASTPITTATDSAVVAAGEVIATAAPGTSASAWFGVCMQDRLVRDPALWSSQIDDAMRSAAIDPGAWTAFAATLAGLGSPLRQIYILDHMGIPWPPPRPRRSPLRRLEVPPRSALPAHPMEAPVSLCPPTAR